MGRKALEAVFGALGSGLIGYGKDKNLRMDREEERLRREEESRRAEDQRRMQLFQSGLEVAAPLQARAKAIGQAGALAGGAPSVPGMAASGMVGRALEQAGRDMGTDLTRGRKLTMGGVDYVQPFSRTADGRDERDARQAASDRAVGRMEGREDAVFRNELETKRDVARESARRSGDVSADRNDRTRRAAAEYIQRSKGRIVPGSFEGAPSTVQAYTPTELQDLRLEVYSAYGLNPDGSELTVRAPVVASTERPPNEIVLQRRRDEAIAAVEARLLSTAQKARAKKRIEDAYRADLAQLGPR